jgi:hypothetical protein
MPQLVAYTINITNDVSRSINDAFRTVIDDSRVTLQILTSLAIVIYKYNMLIVHATVGNPH